MFCCSYFVSSSRIFYLKCFFLLRGLFPPYMCIRYSTIFLLSFFLLSSRLELLLLLLFSWKSTSHTGNQLFVLFLKLCILWKITEVFLFLFGHIPFQHFLDLFYLIFRFFFFQDIFLIPPVFSLHVSNVFCFFLREKLTIHFYVFSLCPVRKSSFAICTSTSNTNPFFLCSYFFRFSPVS